MKLSCRLRLLTKWSRIVAEAEKLVNYSGSFVSLRCLLSDEVADVAFTVRKLIGTKHPLLNTARQFLYNGNQSVQTRGLIILLVAQSGNKEIINTYEETEGGVTSSQRSLAEISELIYTANLMHRGILNAEDMDPETYNSLSLGNKMAILGGDYLLASASMALARIGNVQVTDSIARGIAEMSEAEFVGEPGESCKVYSLEDWEKKIYLSTVTDLL